MRKSLQAFEHSQHSPFNTLWHQTISLSILRQEVSSEVRYEETHLYSYRWVSYILKKSFLIAKVVQIIFIYVNVINYILWNKYKSKYCTFRTISNSRSIKHRKQHERRALETKLCNWKETFTFVFQLFTGVVSVLICSLALLFNHPPSLPSSKTANIQLQHVKDTHGN